MKHQQNNLWRAAILIGVVMICVFLLCACGGASQTGKFEKYVEAYQYNDALNEYYEKIEGNAQMESEALSFLRKYLDDSLNDYAAGKISDTDMDAVMTTLWNLTDGIYVFSDEMYEANDTYWQLTSSKESYQWGMQLMEQEDYLDAIYAFYDVIDLDTENYKSAQEQISKAEEMYRTEAINEIRQAIDNGAYQNAVSLLKTAEYIIGDGNEFQTLQKEAYSHYAEEVAGNVNDLFRQEQYTAGINLLDEAINYTGYDDVFEQELTSAFTVEFEKTLTDYLDKDFPTAKAYYDAIAGGLIEVSADMDSKYAEGERNYRTSVLNDAKAAVEEDNYVKAFNLVDEGLSVLPDDPDLLDYQAQIETAQADYLRRTTPVNLSELEPYQGSMYTGTRHEDIFGISYDGFLGTSDTRNATYRIDGIYSSFTGSIFIDSTNTKGEGTVKIYGDGVELYSATIHGGEDATQFNIDISGVRDLTIDMKITYNVWKNMYIGNPILTP